METGIIPEPWDGTRLARGRNEGASHGNRVVGPARPPHNAGAPSGGMKPGVENAGVRQRQDDRDPDVPHWSWSWTCIFLRDHSYARRWGLRTAFEVLQYRPSWVSQYKPNFSILFCSFVVVRTYVLAKSWISIWGSENMAPITIAQLDCALN